ncbi:MAG TPA: MarC family protein [Thermoanaerobaculia bacterium]|jgi:multiple antibiotic resistance protein
MIQKIVRDFMMIWTTIDPIGNVAIFSALTGSRTPAERASIARRSSIYAAIILVVAVVIGQIVLDAVGVRMLSLQVAGGIILFLFAVKMLFGEMDEGAPSADPKRDLAVFPIAVPSIAGPGAIMAVIILTDNDVYTVPQQMETAVVLLVVLLINYLFFRLSDPILRIIGKQGAAVLIRVMGILLASLAVEIVMKALSVGDWAVPKGH